MRLLITGTSSGIGRTLAKTLSADGHMVWGLARRSQQALGEELRSVGLSFDSSICDVAQWDQVVACREEIQTMWAGVEGIVCCAGVQAPVGPTMTLDPAAWSCNITVNLTGCFHVLRAFAPLLQRDAGRAKVICFSGGGAAAPRPNFSAYAVSKAGLVRLVENLATEWRNDKVDINAVAPGAVRTAMTEEVVALGPDLAGASEYHSARERLAEDPTDVDPAVELVRFLLSEDSDGISGRLISAKWDAWEEWSHHLNELRNGDMYTLRRITGRDRGAAWGDR